MIVKVLMENTPCAEGFVAEHGLSLYLEAAGKKLLFDSGASDAFVQNAAALGVDLSAVELAVLSHGHFDHGGGLPAFLSRNHTAPVYLQRAALKPYFSSKPENPKKYIGLDPALRESAQLRPVDGDLEIAPGLRLFSSVAEQELLSSANNTLFCERDGALVPDPFLHEQSLLIEENGEYVLLAGCAHRGIVNIVDRAVELTGKPLRAVIGGFHLNAPSGGAPIPAETVEAIAARLLAQPGTAYYTCHCTGESAFAILKARMGARLLPLRAGQTLKL